MSGEREALRALALGIERPLKNAGALVDDPAALESIQLALERLEALRAALASQEEPVGWQPIETAPRDGTRILVFAPGARRAVREVWWRIPYDGAALRKGWWCYDGIGTLLDASVHHLGATHWMPLPAGPAIDATEEGG